MFCFFSFVLTFCFVDVRHAHASRPSRSWIFFLYIIFISRHRSEQKKEERRTRFLFYLMADVFEPLHILYVKHVHMHTRDKTIYRCFVTSFFLFLFFFFINSTHDGGCLWKNVSPNAQLILTFDHGWHMYAITIFRLLTITILLHYNQQGR
jgi:hypothetical protein